VSGGDNDDTREPEPEQDAQDEDPRRVQYRNRPPEDTEYKRDDD
jgi:hypothetical protein